MALIALYGTLRHRPLLEAVAGDLGGATARAGVLPGHRVACEAGGALPVLVAASGREAPCLLLDGLPEEARARLDAWEVPWGYRLAAVTARAEGAGVAARAYHPPPEVRPGPEDWNLEAWLAEEGERTLACAREVADTAPRPDGEALRRQWPMIAHRAAARARAARAAPTALRRRAEAGDATWRRARPLRGAFFRLDGLEVGHRRLDGGRHEGLPREVFVGVDAALVLPYDARRGRVLLVEQLRVGPLRRGDPQPWVLEPVAGLIDAGETPEEAARREAAEEAGLEVDALVPMFAGYASPGGSTDHFWCFLAPCDLPDGHATRGGLASEAEDLRLHVLPLDDALALVDSGEANALPLVSMLLWLDRWRRL